MTSGDAPIESFLEYDDAAKARVRRLGATAISEFVAAIPRARLAPWLNKLRPIKGFRAKGSAAAEEQRKRLIQRLASDSKSANAWDWVIFKHCWQMWVEMHTTSRPVREAVSGSIDQDETIVSVADALKQFASICQREAESHALSKENLQSLLDFGPFADLEPFSTAMNLALPAREIERSQYLDALPGRLAEIDESLKQLAAKSTQIAESDQPARSTNDLSEHLRQATDLLSSLSTQVGSIELRQTEAFQQIEALRDSVALQTIRLDGIEARSAEPAETALPGEPAPYVNDLLEVISQLDALENVVEKLSESIATVTVDNKNEEHASSSHVASDLVSDPPTRNSVEPQIIFELRTVEALGPTTYLSNHKDLLRSISDNLAAIGLLSESADSIALEVLSALLSRQQISFFGSLASIVIEACVSTLSDTYTVAQVPVGLCDTSDLTRWLSQSESSPIIVLESANASAFEIYGGSVRQRTIRSQLNSDVTPLRVFCELIPGPGGLPLIPSYAELGPVINTDALSWRSRGSAIRLTAARLSDGLLETPFDDPADDADFLEQIAKSLDALPFQISIVLYRSMMRTASLMMMLEANRSQDKILGSLVASWLLPFAVASGNSPRSFADSLLTTPAAAAASSARVKKLLSHRPLQ